MEQGGPTVLCDSDCTVSGRLSIDTETPCVVLTSEETGERLALAWEEQSVEWIGSDAGSIRVHTAFPIDALLEHGDRITVEGTPLDPASPFLTPSPAELCAPELWLVNFVLTGAPVTDAPLSGTPTPTPSPG